MNIYFLGPHHEESYTKSVIKWRLSKVKEEENIPLTQGKSEHNTNMNTVIGTTYESGYHHIASP